MPKRYDIVVRGDDEGKKEYIMQRLAGREDASVVVKKFRHHLIISVNPGGDKALVELVFDVVAECAVIYEKYNVTIHEINSLGIDNMVYCCLIGSILSIGLVDELELAKSFYSGKSVLCPDVFVNFAMRDLLEKWRGLTDFAGRLIAGCNGTEELMELVLFLLTLDGVKSGNVKVSKTHISVGGTSKPHMKLAMDRESDVLISVVKEKPLSITIEKTSEFSQGFLKTIRMLGK